MIKGTLKDAIEAIEKELGRTVTQAEVGAALDKTQTNIAKRLQSKSEVKLSELNELQKYFKCHILRELGFIVPDAVEIVYYDNPKFKHLIETEDVDSLWYDRQLVHNVWKKSEKDLRVITILGNSMDGGFYPLPNGSKIIIDITSTDILRSGVYAYVTKAGLFLNSLQKLPCGDVEFIYANSMFEKDIYTPQQLKEMEFEIVGRLIKATNLYEG